MANADCIQSILCGYAIAAPVHIRIVTSEFNIFANIHFEIQTILRARDENYWLLIMAFGGIDGRGAL